MIHTSNSRQYRGLTDEELVRQVWPNQPILCMELLYNRYAHKVYGQCSSMTHDLDTADDFTQDIFLKVFTKLDHFTYKAKFSTWLYAVAHNYCIDQIRARKRAPFVGIDDQAELDLVAFEPDSLPEDRLPLVYMAIDKLTPKEQLVLGLKYEANLKIREIAQLCALHPTTIKMQLHRSKAKIKQLIESSQLRSE